MIPNNQFYDVTFFNNTLFDTKTNKSSMYHFPSNYVESLLGPKLSFLSLDILQIFNRLLILTPDSLKTPPQPRPRFT